MLSAVFLSLRKGVIYQSSDSKELSWHRGGGVVVVVVVMVRLCCRPE